MNKIITLHCIQKSLKHIPLAAVTHHTQCKGKSHDMTMMPPTPQCSYSKEVKKLIIYQTTVLNWSPMEISINLNMPVHVMQWVLQTCDEIGVVVRELKRLRWACLMMTDQVQVSMTSLSSGVGWWEQAVFALIEQTPGIYVDELHVRVTVFWDLTCAVSGGWRVYDSGVNQQCCN